MAISVLEVAEILRHECGMNEYEQDYFERWWDGTGNEHRFQGNLGFGGKIYRNCGGQALRVGCYREDDTPERTAAIERANRRLNDLLARERKG